MSELTELLDKLDRVYYGARRFQNMSLLPHEYETLSAFARKGLEAEKWRDEAFGAQAKINHLIEFCREQSHLNSTLTVYQIYERVAPDLLPTPPAEQQSEQQENSNGNFSDPRDGNRDLDNHAQDRLRGRMVTPTGAAPMGELETDLCGRALPCPKCEGSGHAIARFGPGANFERSHEPCDACAGTGKKRATIPSPQADAGEIEYECSLEDGKYIYQRLKGGGQRALRYNEEWRDFVGDKFIYCAFALIERQAAEIDKWRHSWLVDTAKLTDEISRLRAVAGRKDEPSGYARTDGLSPREAHNAGEMLELNNSRLARDYQDLVARLSEAQATIERQAAEIERLNKNLLGRDAAIRRFVDENGRQAAAALSTTEPRRGFWLVGTLEFDDESRPFRVFIPKED